MRVVCQSSGIAHAAKVPEEGLRVVIGRIISVIRRRIDPVGYARSIGVKIGEGCRLIHVTYSTEPYLIQLGNHVSATKTHFETHDGGVWVFRDQYPDLDIVRPIRVGDNVYFGYGCVVLPGVTIGSNVIVGAGAVVTRDIPDNSVSVGVPARVIKRLDEYAEAAISSGHPTKRMTWEEKRQYYTKIFAAE
jgi:acetyltransferase-like isoleucine patch superfamily enzyme